MNVYFIIGTEQNKYYIVDNQNNITQYDASIPVEKHSFSNKWKCLGLTEILPFNNSGPLSSPGHLYVESAKMKFKNGKGKYRLHDLDYGTHRIWGDRVVALWCKCIAV